MSSFFVSKSNIIQQNMTVDRTQNGLSVQVVSHIEFHDTMSQKSVYYILLFWLNNLSVYMRNFQLLHFTFINH